MFKYWGLIKIFILRIDLAFILYLSLKYIKASIAEWVPWQHAWNLNLRSSILKTQPKLENALSIKDSSGNWNRQSWKDFYNLTESISKSLLACNINKNDKVSIYSYNRVEWSACYAAIQQINAVSVGVYHTCSSSDVEWIVGNSDSKIVFVGNNPNDSGEKDKMPNHRLIAILDNLNNVELVVFMEGIEKLKHKKCINEEGWQPCQQKQ